MRLSSLQNPQIKAWAALRTTSGRRQQGLFLAEGEHLAGEALQAGAAQALLVNEERQEQYEKYLNTPVPVYLMPPHVLQKVCDARTPQGILAVCPIPAQQELGSMDAAGFTGLVVDGKTADPFSPKVLRASMGAVFRVPVYRCESLVDVLKGQGYALLAGDLQGEDFFARDQVEGKLGLLIGNEGQGLDADARTLATHRLRLPMPGGAESLNAAIAAAIMMYDVVRRNG
jgi:TrmH family RNA methyltransferase